MSYKTLDANEAVARIAHAFSEVIAIYPITPSSPMAESCDAWSASERKNLFGTVPEVIEMQSEAGVGGAIHGALQAGALATTFTASQGLLLMIPNMYKIAGELTPTVFHVAARTLATHALSIFGDHSDVMACRGTGWAMLCAGSVQEAQDFACISHAATLTTRIPFLHFFDGFRTSHEVNRIEELSLEQLREMLDQKSIEAHQKRALSPDHPVLRGSAQNPDVFFQAREAINPWYDRLPAALQETMSQFATLTGRAYQLFDYYGDARAERVIVMMGSGCGAVKEATDLLNKMGERVGLVQVRLYRPFDQQAFIDCLPATTQQIAVLDRLKEPGAVGEPLFQDVVTTLAIAARRVGGALPENAKLHARVIGGRYGIASKEFTPAMVAAIFRELAQDNPKPTFTVGIMDDVTHLSLPVDPDFSTDQPDVVQALFYGLGSDGTVGATKNSVKIIGESTPLVAQGYFVYDSKKSGAMTVSHLRISPRPIESSYLIRKANFVACHQFHFLERIDVLELAAPGATFLLNSPHGPQEVWDHLPIEIQQTIIERQIRLFVIDAFTVAREAGMSGRINTVMQTCFFALLGILPRDEAIQQIKKSIQATYAKRGQSVIDRNFEAVDRSLAALHEATVPGRTSSLIKRQPSLTGVMSDFVQRVTSVIAAGHGDKLPVSAMPCDGTFPTSTAKLEKRRIAAEIPIWEPELCIQCGLCSFVCPHAAIRVKTYRSDHLESAPEDFPSRHWTGKDRPGNLMTIQVAPDDCTGCGVCVDVCPAKSKTAVKLKAINMQPIGEHLEREQSHFDFFLSLPDVDRESVNVGNVKDSQLLLPLFEFSGACAGCGETPYLRLLSQLFGDRMVVANATGCSSIYGGNLPTTPWSQDPHGRGPAWSNSLFEDNAEFGLGIRLGLDQRETAARSLLRELQPLLPGELVQGLLSGGQHTEQELSQQRERVERLKHLLASLPGEKPVILRGLADALVKKVVWIIGGDGWAYDIGFGGLDHTLASGKNVNVLILDTEVYSNTGGQSSKSTPRAAIAKFAASGKSIAKKDVGMIAMAYGHVYVAQVALGAHPLQTLRAFQEAESYVGPSLIIAYSQCIAHGVEMSTGMTHQKEAVNSGYWPLYRFDPRIGHDGGKPFQLDCRKPKLSFKQFASSEARFAMLQKSNPRQAERLFELAQQDINDRWHYYEQISNVERSLAGFIDEVPQ